MQTVVVGMWEGGGRAGGGRAEGKAVFIVTEEVRVEVEGRSRESLSVVAP